MNASSAKVNVLIVGTGMYVCGRGTATYGTVLPAVLQAAKTGLVGDILVATRSGRSFGTLDEKWRGVETLIGHKSSCRRFPDSEERDPQAYRRAVAELPDPGAVIVAGAVPQAVIRRVGRRVAASDGRPRAGSGLLRQPGHSALQRRHETVDLGVAHRRREASQALLGDDDPLVEQVEVQLGQAIGRRSVPD